MSKPLWMVRAGSGSVLISDFLEQQYVGIGFSDELGAVKAGTSREEILRRMKECYPDRKEAKVINAAGQLYRFHSEMQVGDQVVTYDSAGRRYFLGAIKGAVEHMTEGLPYQRPVQWTHRVDRDSLDVATRNTLGSTLTVFLPNEEAAADLRAKAVDIQAPEPEGPGPKPEHSVEADMDALRASMLARAEEFIEDMIVALDADDMEQLVAGILRGMGYKSRVSPKGADRGVDVFASPDGLGLEEPRIFVEVKHRLGTKVGAQMIRSFLGGRKQGDRCLFVSTGGFAKDALYEAERATVPLRLIDLPLLRELLVEHYANLDEDSRRLVPLVRLYWPAPTDA
jgi:restriction system protein